MPEWLKRLQETTFLFWEDSPLDWGQAVALLFGEAGLYSASRLTFAGTGTLLDKKALLIVMEMPVALILLATARRLGDVAVWGPKFIRMLAMHLNVVMILLASNFAWRWANLLPSLGWIAVAANVLASVLLLAYTIGVRPVRTPRRAIIIVFVAIFVTLFNIWLTLAAVLPAQVR